MEQAAGETSKKSWQELSWMRAGQFGMIIGGEEPIFTVRAYLIPLLFRCFEVVLAEDSCSKQMGQVR